MIKIYPADSRYSADHGWLQANLSFSFGEFNDPDNMNFGPLRVFNDDYIHPKKGFGTHPHRDMEIVTVALKGLLQHEDNTGGKEVLRPGEVQRMTAGTGILHSEVNISEDEIANVLQLWFLPNERGLTPSYEQRAYDPQAMKNDLLPVVSSRMQAEGVTFINQDLTLYLSELEAGRNLTFEQGPDRKIYVFVIAGSVKLNGEAELARRDAARITDAAKLDIQTGEGATFMLIDLP
ncbi:pirin family protein [Paenibacillus solisilvae]|uniref:Pirin family protein n=1 Tax=Paenibacillus solisilvae TaxID=2486751 RepID=A0ABW0W7T9_9BACL